MKYIRYSLQLAIITAITILSILSAHAGSLIENQQQDLTAIAPSWTKLNIPAGMPQAESAGNVRTSTTSGVSLLAHHVNFIFTSNIGFYIDNLAASFEPLNSTEPVNMDDPRQFIIHVHSGTVIIPPDSLTALFNKQILDYWPRPLNNLTVCTGRNWLSAQGGLRLWSWLPPIGWIPAYLNGGMVLSQQKLVYIPQDIRALGIPIGGLLQSLGIKLTYLLSLNRQGAHLVGSTIVLDHTKVFPPPAIVGTIASISLDEAGLHIIFSDNSNPKFSLPDSTPDSFIWIQSGDIKLFDIVITNANVLIKDENKNANLRFNLYDYRRMIAAKNILKMQEDGSIIVTLSTSSDARASCS